MRERMASLVPFLRRWRWVCVGIALAMALTGTLVVAAHHGPPVTANDTPAAASGTARATASASATATVGPPVASPTVGTNASLGLACTAHSSPGDGDDSVDMALVCTVTGMPGTDTSFSLSFGVLDPVGHVHPFTQACTGTLHGGKGSCHQSYTYIYPFLARPGLVTGQSLPSHHYLGPVTPTQI